jgi:hypothetical protein
MTEKAIAGRIRASLIADLGRLFSLIRPDQRQIILPCIPLFRAGSWRGGVVLLANDHHHDCDAQGHAETKDVFAADMTISCGGVTRTAGQTAEAGRVCSMRRR